MNYGVYVRYGIEKHRHIADEWPEIGVVLFRETYEQASRDAWAACHEKLKGLDSVPVTWVHHPHSETEDTGKNDPLNLFGSWGWKTTDAMSAEHK